MPAGKGLWILKKDPSEIYYHYLLEYISWSYASQGLYHKALLIQKRVIAICLEEFGPDHQIMQSKLNNLSNMYLELGRYSEAERSGFTIMLFL